MKKSYEERQKGFRARVGDIVTIFRKPTSLEWYNGWDNWADEMYATIEHTGTIKKINSRGIYVFIDGVPGPDCQDNCWLYPYTALKIIR